jgi:hypothetical protein
MLQIIQIENPVINFRFYGGEGGIRTRVGPFGPHPISSRRRYDRFGTSPAECVCMLTQVPTLHNAPDWLVGW